MIEIHYSRFNSVFNRIAIEAISKVLSITKTLVGGSTYSWRVDFIDVKGRENHWFLYGNRLHDGLKIDNEFHGPDDEDWEAWVAKYNHNLEIEHALEKL